MIQAVSLQPLLLLLHVQTAAFFLGRLVMASATALHALEGRSLHPTLHTAKHAYLCQITRSALVARSVCLVKQESSPRQIVPAVKPVQVLA